MTNSATCADTDERAAFAGVWAHTVVGAPDPVRDEVPHAFVVTLPGEDGAGIDEELTAWCAERLSKSKRPRAFTVIDELPKTSVGKIRTYVLKEAAPQ